MTLKVRIGRLEAVSGADDEPTWADFVEYGAGLRRGAPANPDFEARFAKSRDGRLFEETIRTARARAATGGAPWP